MKANEVKALEQAFNKLKKHAKKHKLKTVHKIDKDYYLYGDEYMLINTGEPSFNAFRFDTPYNITFAKFKKQVYQKEPKKYVSIVQDTFMPVDIPNGICVEYQFLDILRLLLNKFKIKEIHFNYTRNRVMIKADEDVLVLISTVQKG